MIRAALDTLASAFRSLWGNPLRTALSASVLLEVTHRVYCPSRLAGPDGRALGLRLADANDTGCSRRLATVPEMARANVLPEGSVPFCVVEYVSVAFLASV